MRGKSKSVSKAEITKFPFLSLLLIGNKENDFTYSRLLLPTAVVGQHCDVAVILGTCPWRWLGMGYTSSH
jgi:hypothetical protein